MILSSANISYDSYLKISRVSRETGLERSTIIETILLWMTNKYLFGENKPCLFSRIKYQKKKRHSSDWKIINIYIPENLYESCLDCRKLFKVSVSSVLESGISLFLNLIINTMKNPKNRENKINNYYILSITTRNRSSFDFSYIVKLKAEKHNKSP